jgi:hypothetical protein
MNSHSFTKTDVNNQHKTLDTIDNIPNQYIGEHFELLQKHNRYFIDEHQKIHFFDGDTIEFVTQDFYKKDVDSVIAELNTIKKEFTETCSNCCTKKIYFHNLGT